MRRLTSMLAAGVLAAGTLFATAGAASAGAAAAHHRADCVLDGSAHLHVTGGNGVNYFLGTPVNTFPGAVVFLKPTANSTTNWQFCFVPGSTNPPEYILLNPRNSSRFALTSTQDTGGLVTVQRTSAPAGNGFASQRWHATFSGNFVFLQNENTGLWLRVRNSGPKLGQTVTTGATPRGWNDSF
jgi:hypothetical protein